MYELQNLGLCIDHVNVYPLFQEKYGDVLEQKR